ncbi:ankyrin-3 [Galleria mellonella]|uniref:Ankyrin-3 n=1 Tax=Galleria mellonella TaxID=7137 RepID=A0A6J1WWV2_GALME|nr:ankyrin-3 [Galleria mellonella]
MEKSPEDNLYQAILIEDQEAVSHLLKQGANPNKTASHGKTCLGEAANVGNVSIVRLLIDATKTNSPTKIPHSGSLRKMHTKSQKRKLRLDGQHDETVVKCKNINERSFKEYCMGHCNIGAIQESSNMEKNQGYFVFIHSEGSTSDESKMSSLKSPLSPTTLTPSPQADLEWDEEIGSVAPTTSEDETWSSMYKWYAAILECTGAAIAAASVVTNGIDQQDTFMRTALHYAAEQGHVEAVKLLLDAGCKVDISASDGLTPLHVAVIRNHLEIVKLLLEGGSHVNYTTHKKMTPLHFAASQGFLDMVKILVSYGAYLEARDTNERSALYLAAGQGHIDVVKYLISLGANVNGEEIHGYTPLCEAVWHRYTNVVEVLLAAGARVTHSHKLLHNAIIQRQEEIVKMLANLGGGINLHNDNGDTPLLLAARLSQPSIAQVLLEKGANVNACNSITGANALHIAVESIDCPKEFEELLVCLLEYKIETNSTALTGDTALNRALLLHRDHAAMLLIRHGVDVNACDLRSCGLDNLSIASRKISPNLACMLLRAGHCTTLDPIAMVPKSGSAAYWLYYASKQPLNLTDLCRIKIRHTCRNMRLFSYIENLPLPKSLKRFLKMEDEGLY